jgi:NADP-dependent 3-hydroxy acid dehydrogenase YdfG
MRSTLAGKVAFVTGGASGIGAALATRLVGEGAEVWIGDRQADQAEGLAQRLNGAGGKAHAVELDVRSYPAFERAIEEVIHRSGRIDFLFDNAGISIAGEVDSLSLDDWNDVFDVNVRGVVHGIQAVYSHMIEQHSGHIINTASLAGLTVDAGNAPYTASKHAVVGISKTLRIEAERHGIQVSVLCPGVVRTPMMTGGTYGRLRANVDEAQYVKEMFEPLKPMAPDAFAERALRGVLRGRAIIVLPAWYRATWFLERLSPALSMRMSRLALNRKRRLESTSS